MLPRCTSQWMAVGKFLQDEDFTKELYNRLFARHKEPESRIVKDYYGTDVIVPGWARWVAMNRSGRVMAFNMQPDILSDSFWGYDNYDKRGRMTQVAWRDETTSHANWKDSMREVKL